MAGAAGGAGGMAMLGMGASEAPWLSGAQALAASAAAVAGVLAQLAPRRGVPAPRAALILEELGEELPAVAAAWSPGAPAGAARRPVAAVSAGGALASATAPVFFDSRNPHGARPWGPAARGCVVVARRGECSFERKARNAAAACAAALIVVDGQSQQWDPEQLIEREEPPLPGPPLVLPTVLVPAERGEVLCFGESTLHATVVLRQ